MRIGKHFCLHSIFCRQFGLSWEAQVGRLWWYLCPYFIEINWATGDYLGDGEEEQGNRRLCWINFRWLSVYLNNRQRRKQQKEDLR